MIFNYNKYFRDIVNIDDYKFWEVPHSPITNMTKLNIAVGEQFISFIILSIFLNLKQYMNEWIHDGDDVPIYYFGSDIIKI